MEEGGSINYLRVSSLLENSFESADVKQEIPLGVRKVNENDISMRVSRDMNSPSCPSAGEPDAEESASERTCRGGWIESRATLRKVIVAEGGGRPQPGAVELEIPKPEIQSSITPTGP